MAGKKKGKLPILFIFLSILAISALSHAVTASKPSPINRFYITIISPPDNSILTTPIDYLNLVFRIDTNVPSITSAFCHIKLFKNGALFRERDYEAAIRQNNSWAIGQFNRGRYQWAVSCVSGGYKDSKSATFTYYEDTNFTNSELAIKLISPPNNLFSTDENNGNGFPYPFIWHISSNDTNLTHATCKWQLFVNNAVFYSETFNTSFGSDKHYPNPIIYGRGYYRWTVSCSAGNYKADSTHYFTYLPDTNFTDAPLTVTIIAPKNEEVLSDPDPSPGYSYIWHVSSNNGNFTHADCHFQLFSSQGLIDEWVSPVAIGYDDYYSLNNWQRGDYTWSMYCNTSNIHNKKEAKYSSIIDVPSKVTIDLLSPANNSISRTGEVKYRLVPHAILANGTEINLQQCILRVWYYDPAFCPDPADPLCYAPEFSANNLSSGREIDYAKIYSDVVPVPPFGQYVQNYFPWYVFCRSNHQYYRSPGMVFYVNTSGSKPIGIGSNNTTISDMARIAAGVKNNTTAIKPIGVGGNNNTTAECIAYAKPSCKAGYEVYQYRDEKGCYAFGCKALPACQKPIAPACTKGSQAYMYYDSNGCAAYGCKVLPVSEGSANGDTASGSSKIGTKPSDAGGIKNDSGVTGSSKDAVPAATGSSPSASDDSAAKISNSIADTSGNLYAKVMGTLGVYIQTYQH